MAVIIVIAIAVAGIDQDISSVMIARKAIPIVIAVVGSIDNGDPFAAIAIVGKNNIAIIIITTVIITAVIVTPVAIISSAAVVVASKPPVPPADLGVESAGSAVLDGDTVDAIALSTIATDLVVIVAGVREASGAVRRSGDAAIVTRKAVVSPTTIYRDDNGRLRFRGGIGGGLGGRIREDGCDAKEKRKEGGERKTHDD